MKVKNSYKKTKIWLGVAMLTGGAIASTVVYINYLNNTEFQYCNLGKFVWDSKTNSQDVVTAIIDNESINTFKNESISFLKSKIYTYDLKVLGLSNEKASANAYAQANNYEKEFNEIVNKYYDDEYFEIQKDSLSSPFVVVYTKLLDLNKKYDIDPIDYNQFQNTLLPQVKEKILNNVAISQKPQISQKFTFLEKQAKDKILKEHLNSFHLNKFLASTLNEEGLSEDKELELVGIEVAKMISNKTLVLNEEPTTDFASLLSPYSDNGQVGHNEKEGKNILQPDEINKIFFAKRDYLGDAIMLQPDENRNLSDDFYNIEEKNDQNYLPLDKYIPTVEGMPGFEKNEIIPGYTIHAKIASIDYGSDSNLVKVGIQVGVSKTADVNQNIFWIHGSDDEVNKADLSYDFKVSHFNQKQNCANNFFYPNELKLTYKNKDFDVKEIVNRSTITTILEDAPTDTNDYYLFDENHPYLLNIDDLELPGIVKPHQLENDHKNEKIMLAITNANTNFMDAGSLQDLLSNQELVNDYANPYRFKNLIPYVEAKWVLADTDPETEEYKIIKEFNWTDSKNGNKISTLPIYFPYSNSDLDLLQTGNFTAKFIHDFYVLAYDENGNKRNIGKDIYKNMQISAGVDGALSGLITISALANDVFSCITAFGGAWAFGEAIACSIIDGFLAYNGAITSYAKIDILPSIKDVGQFIEMFQMFIPKNIAKTYADFYDKLNDPLVSAKAKLDIALISKNYIYTDFKSVFQYFNYINGMIANEPKFMEESKKWIGIMMDDSFKVREFLTWEVRTFGDNSYVDLDSTKEFLNYHNKDIVKAFKSLESDELPNVSEATRVMLYDFKIHRCYFELFSMINVVSFLLTKTLGLVGLQAYFWRNIINNPVIEEAPKSVPRPEIPQFNTGSRFGDFIANIRFRRYLNQRRHDFIPLDVDFVGDDLDYNLPRQTEPVHPEVNHEARFVQNEETITKGDNLNCFLKGQKINKGLAKASLITGGIVLLVGVAQILVDNLYTVIPEDKAKLMEQLWSKL